MSSAGWNSISSCFQHGLQDGYLSLKPHVKGGLFPLSRYTRLQTVWSLPGPSRQANKGHSPRCHRRPNGPGRLADKVVQPTTQSAEGCTYKGCKTKRQRVQRDGGAIDGAIASNVPAW